jgi:magnesium-transporting ATPase (P-type)
MSAVKIQLERARAPYQGEVHEVLNELGTDAGRGLSEAEALARLEQYGRNELVAEKPVPAWRKLTASNMYDPGDAPTRVPYAADRDQVRCEVR